jgi:hypothetical protein
MDGRRLFYHLRRKHDLDRFLDLWCNLLRDESEEFLPFSL